MVMQHLLKNIPNVNECLTVLAASEEFSQVPRQRLKHCTRLFLEEFRSFILNGHFAGSADEIKAHCLAGLIGYVLQYHQPKFIQVINATGVIIHTNLGRSLLPATIVDTFLTISRRYSNLEYNLVSGQRGSRYDHVDSLLCELTGAEASLVVNNNAAAVLLCLETLARDREVIVSRGQLIEIGGSFRIPDIMARSGARLVEVGTTNRTHLQDYRQALSTHTGLLLKVHCSNYRIIGFTHEVSSSELVQLGKEQTLPVMEDLGSGCLVDLSKFGLTKEPTVQDTVRAGVDIVTFSGDKLLGGPQAGIIIGKTHYINKIKQNPLNRALRIDKFTLAGLESVLRLYLDEAQAVREIPTLAMISQTAEQVKRRADELLQRLTRACASDCHCEVVLVHSRVGGGAMPEQSLPSWAVALQPSSMKISELERRLRRVQPPVIGRMEDDCLLLDMRTVAEDELELLETCLCKALFSKF